jgi:hypothetical protein
MAVTLTLDASLSTTSLFLNGKELVTARPAGYLPLIIRLDGAGLVFGGENVLVVYVVSGEIAQERHATHRTTLTINSITLPKSKRTGLRRLGGGTRARVSFATPVSS